jgi:hypothetical protein
MTDPYRTPPAGWMTDEELEAAADDSLREYERMVAEEQTKELAAWVSSHAPPPPTGQALNDVARSLGTLRFPREADQRLQHRLALMLTMEPA